MLVIGINAIPGFVQSEAGFCRAIPKTSQKRPAEIKILSVISRVPFLAVPALAAINRLIQIWRVRAQNLFPQRPHSTPGYKFLSFMAESRLCCHAFGAKSGRRSSHFPPKTGIYSCKNKIVVCNLQRCQNIWRMSFHGQKST